MITTHAFCPRSHKGQSTFAKNLSHQGKSPTACLKSTRFIMESNLKVPNHETSMDHPLVIRCLPTTRCTIDLEPFTNLACHNKLDMLFCRQCRFHFDEAILAIISAPIAYRLKALRTFWWFKATMNWHYLSLQSWHPIKEATWWHCGDTVLDISKVDSELQLAPPVSNSMRDNNHRFHYNNLRKRWHGQRNKRKDSCIANEPALCVIVISGARDSMLEPNSGWQCSRQHLLNPACKWHEGIVLVVQGNNELALPHPAILARNQTSDLVTVW